MKTSTESLKPKELKETLARLEHEYKETIERVQNLRESIAALRKLCGKPPVLPENYAPIQTIKRRRTRTAELANYVIEVLRAAHRPMHVKEIVEKLAQSGHAVVAQNPEKTVAVALSRRTDQFKKVSGNTFVLEEKKDGNLADTA